MTIPGLSDQGAQARLFGIPIFTRRDLFEKKVRVERRVRGGHMNRWLIREVVWETKIDHGVMHDRMFNRMYCHPATLDVLLQLGAQGLSS